MTAKTEPKLAPPGGGLPKPELYVGRMLFALRRWTANRAFLDARFQRERERIRQLVRSCDADSLARRVLIRRPPGLEDSSRYWSVLMTLDHLRIVHHEIIRVITALTKGVMPQGTASTATVKPSAEVTAAVVSEYEQSCDALLAAVAAAGNLKTALRFAHPWFGPLDAAGWHALSVGHMGIHRVQMERICAGLRGSASVAHPRPAETGSKQKSDTVSGQVPIPPAGFESRAGLGTERRTGTAGSETEKQKAREGADDCG